jgi:uncharacterized BrkB/YihY/UPF0761 family membrane protein
VALRRFARPLPLVSTLLVSIETHALCGALAFFAMLGFYPLSVLLISLAKYVLRSPAAHEVVRLAVQSYYPAGQEFVLRNLEASSSQLRGELSVVAALWIFLGGAGVFMPLEMAFNRMWGFAQSRSYWHNQLVGLILTIAGWAIAVVLVLAVSVVPLPYREVAMWLTAPVLAAVAIFLAYRLLPHGHVPAGIALEASLLTAVVCEVVRWLFLLALPRLDLAKSHGPFRVSVSFLLFAYVEAYVLLAGAFRAAEATRARQAADRVEPPARLTAIPPRA